MQIGFRDLLDGRAAVIAAGSVLLLLLICIAVVFRFGEYYFSQSHPLVLATSFPLFPGFLLDTYVSPNVHIGRLRWYDMVLTVGVSWMVWTSLAWAVLMWLARRRLLIAAANRPGG